MRLNIFTVLLFVLFAKGHSLKCYRCTNLLGSCVKEEIQCSSGETVCASQTLVQSFGEASHSRQIKGCTEPKLCVSGSVNFGVSSTAITMQCCNTDLCNSRDASDSSSKNPNGKQCYYCNGDNCFNRVNCRGTEDYCMTAKVNVESRSMTAKGCASKTMCDVLPQLTQEYAGVSCCQGNLCNSAKSITQNVLLLSWPFISYIMFH